MLRWIVAFMEENEPRWNLMRIEREKDRREKEKEEEWATRSREEKIRVMQLEEKQKKLEMRNNKELRFEEAKRLKRSWTEWREQEEEKQEEMNKEAETFWTGDFLGELDKLCLKCAATPCVCLEGIINKRIELIKLEREIILLRDKAHKAAEKVAENEKLRLVDKDQGSDLGLKGTVLSRGYNTSQQARGEGSDPGTYRESSQARGEGH